jgi:DNA (cytosine-5)-methyltransferase 1
LAWDKPAQTLTTDPIGRATTLCHPEKLRPLTVEEYAKLQQFPADWKFFGVTSQKYLQIGNAVPTGLGLAIGSMLDEVAERTDTDGLPANAKARLGMVAAHEPQLETWLKSRRRTQLHPPWKRKNKDPEAARKWLAEVAA